MTDSDATIEQLKQLVREFAIERDWEQFHHPKDLALALGSEVGELFDLFRFRSEQEVAAGLSTPAGHRAVAHELADCCWAVLRLADVCQIDLAAALVEKVRLAGIKYPVEQARGKNAKYTAYEPENPIEGELP